MRQPILTTLASVHPSSTGSEVEVVDEYLAFLHTVARCIIKWQTCENGSDSSSVNKILIKRVAQA